MGRLREYRSPPREIQGLCIAELAQREGISFTYMPRVLRLTLLAPDVVEAILDGRQGPEVTLAQVMEPFPFFWKNQSAHFWSE